MHIEFLVRGYPRVFITQSPINPPQLPPIIGPRHRSKPTKNVVKLAANSKNVWAWTKALLAKRQVLPAHLLAVVMKSASTLRAAQNALNFLAKLAPQNAAMNKNVCWMMAYRAVVVSTPPVKIVPIPSLLV